VYGWACICTDDQLPLLTRPFVRQHMASPTNAVCAFRENRYLSHFVRRPSALQMYSSTNLSSRTVQSSKSAAVDRHLNMRVARMLHQQQSISGRSSGEVTGPDCPYVDERRELSADWTKQLPTMTENGRDDRRLPAEPSSSCATVSVAVDVCWMRSIYLGGRRANRPATSR